MGVASLPEREVGEAYVMSITSDEDITGATVTARVSLDGATATEYTGTLGSAVDGKIRTASVVIPGSAHSAAGFVTGVVVITKGGADWSPMKERFQYTLKAVP